MTDNSSTDDFFDNVGGSGAPSLKVAGINDGVIGEIVDQFKTEAKVFASDDIKRDKKTGEPIMQLVVILQTDLTNWDRVAKVPLVDKDDRSKGEKPGSEDDGKRALYIEPWTNLHAAVAKAIEAGAGKRGPLKNGARLGVKVVDTKDTGKGNPLKIWEAKYIPPASGSSDEFFGESKTQGGSGDASTSAPAAPKPSGDPWASDKPAGEEKPPF